MAVGAREHVVVLVPGFFSFDEEGRAASALRSALEARWGRAVPVFALPAFAPGSDLRARQRGLLGRLLALDAALGGVRRFHLVGHGPGGVDAELLTTGLPLSPGATWSDLDPVQLRERIASVLTIGSPHYGTHLADQPAWAALRARGHLRLQALAQLGGLAGALGSDVLRSLWRLPAAQSGASASLFALLARLLRGDRMLTELRPRTMQLLRSQNLPDPALRVHVQSLVLVAPDHAQALGEMRGRDELFAVLHRLTGSQAATPVQLPAIAQARALLSAIPNARLVRHPDVQLPGFDLGANDGLVNAARQLLLTRGHAAHSLAGVAVADHADVLGYYRKHTAQRGRTNHPELFRSGAQFGDDQFFQLWGLVASRLAAFDAEQESSRPLLIALQ